MSACSRTPDLRSRSNPSNCSNGQTPTCTTPTRATAPWRTAADSIRARTPCSSMDLSNSAATLTTSAVAIAPSHHRRLRVRNVNIDARMPQPDRAPAVGRLRVADGVGQVCLNRALGVDSGPLNIGAAPRLRIVPNEFKLKWTDCCRPNCGQPCNLASYPEAAVRHMPLDGFCYARRHLRRSPNRDSQEEIDWEKAKVLARQPKVRCPPTPAERTQCRPCMNPMVTQRPHQQPIRKTQYLCSMSTHHMKQCTHGRIFSFISRPLQSGCSSRLGSNRQSSTFTTAIRSLRLAKPSGSNANKTTCAWPTRSPSFAFVFQ